jgi:hypothetical protein
MEMIRKLFAPVGFSFSLLTLRFEAMLLSRGVAEDKEPKTTGGNNSG